MTWKARFLNMAGWRAPQLFDYDLKNDLKNLPPDTFILYPDLLAESLAEFSPGMEPSHSPLRETPISALPISAFQRAANLDYFLRFSSPDDIVRAQRSIRDPLASVELAKENSIPQPEQKAITPAMQPQDPISLQWSWFRATICYMALAFIACLAMFVIPLLRHPKNRLTITGSSALSGPRLASKSSGGRRDPRDIPGGPR